MIENTDLSFRDLQEMIDQANPGTTIHLNRNYIYHRGDNTLNNKEGIKINKDITIDGHGHSIHAQWASGIFQSTEGAIKIMNTIFKYGNQRNADDGGALRILENAQYTIINCTFDSNLANQDGGAIFNTGGNLYISDSTFINNRGHGANKLNDCDGGAIHTTKALPIVHCIFKNNYAADNGGAIYATGGITIRGNPTIFEANTAYNGKGGAIFTNMFDADVNNATFNGNRAGDGATISDDGGAIYIKNKNNVTFKFCILVNNHCTDEGGVIYMNDRKSHINLLNNIFIGNSADDEGQAVYTCGVIDTVKNNIWGENIPSKDNDQLIEWMPALVPNWHEIDKDPLRMTLLVSNDNSLTNEKITALVLFLRRNGAIYDGPTPALDLIKLNFNTAVNPIRNYFVPNVACSEFSAQNKKKTDSVCRPLWIFHLTGNQYF